MVGSMDLLCGEGKSHHPLSDLRVDSYKNVILRQTLLDNIN